MTSPANSIITPQTPKSALANVTTANTNYTAPSNTAALVTAGANGARLTKLQAIPTANVTTANQLQVFRSTDAGVTKRFADSAVMPTYTMAQTTEAPTTDLGYSDANPMIMSAGEILYVAVGQSQSVNFIAEWADY